MSETGVRLPVSIEEEMQRSYLDYAMSVIVGRALPDIRDGMKPVHRRILYAMFREGILPTRRYTKSAGVVGEVLKKYHPHGDSAVYDTIVRMVQDFSLRYPLIDGQGNFGSVDGDAAAAYRYTEVRLTQLAEGMLVDIDKETIDFVPNFDELTVEPSVLPAKVPNLLMNGATGIAVGMATNIPPHNLGELVDALVARIENPEIKLEEVMKMLPGPDFPTAGFITGRRGILDAYRTGRGILTLRARHLIEKAGRSGEKERIVITEIPYQVNKARLIEKIAELVNDKRIEGVADIRDESDREGMRIVLDVKRDHNVEVILNQLYKRTPLQGTFGVIMLALVNNRPKVVSLLEALENFIDFRREVVTRRAAFELRKAEGRAHILEGLKKCLDRIDEVIALIKRSKGPTEARDGLMRRYRLSEIQAQAILDMRLQRLTQLERRKIVEEYNELLKTIARLKEILANDRLIQNIIKDELLEAKEKHSDVRRTEIVEAAKEIRIEDLILDEDMVVTITHSGYIKRNAISLYRAQRRGGKGKMGMTTREEDFVDRLFVSSTHNYILFFTDRGKVYWLKVYDIPQAGRAAKGRPIVNLLSLEEGEKVNAILPVREFSENRNVILVTERGVLKKTDLMAFSNPRRSGIIAVNLDPEDRLIDARMTDGQQEVIIVSAQGKAIRFKESDVRPMGRSARGVIGMRLAEGDGVIAMDTLASVEGATFLTVTENGYGKRSEASEYRLQGRGGGGIITIKTSERNGMAVSALRVTDDSEVMIITDSGKILRMHVKDITVIGRNTQGVRLINLTGGEKVMSVTTLAEKDEEQESGVGSA